jgi:uncharacterized protein YndB with AHSA1/START domain
MRTETIEVSGIVPATPEQIYDAWLDAAAHAAMTGGLLATVEGREAGDRFTVGDGYAWGSHLALERGRRIVQSWRSKDFPAEAADSRLEVLLEASEGGTWVTIRHHEVPEGQGAELREGWETYYLEPMRRHFGGARPARRKKAMRRPARPGGPRRKPVRAKAARAAPRRGARKAASRRGAAGRRKAGRAARRSGARRTRRPARKRR